MRTHLTASSLLALLLAAPALAQDLDLSGSYSVTGKDRSGRFQGTAALRQAADKKVEGDLQLEYVRWNWSSLSYKPTGQRGTARIQAELKGLSLIGRRYTTTGLTDIIGGLDNAQSYAIQYGVARSAQPNQHGSTVKSVGGKFDGSRGQDSLRDHRPSGVTPPPPPPPPPSGDDRITLPPRLLAVPGTPEAGRQALTVVVSGSAATLHVTGPGRVLQNGSLASSLSLQPGTHQLQVEGSGDGRVTVALRRGGSDVATATAESSIERLYVLLFGYQGAEVDYLEGDLRKCVDNILPKLTGYARIEDGNGYDQSKIAQGLADPANPRRVVIDWCVTRDDLFGYLKRGTLRGITWGSHGFMEPFPGCPDAELDRFESRVWTSPAGAPQSTEKKNFVREWQEALRASSATHGKLDFVLMHSCCTGGIGSYADEVWNYTDSTTKQRAMTVLGDPLPTYDRLRYNSFDALGDQVKYLKTYVGPSYFGYHDVSWSQIRGSIEANR